MDTEAQKAEKVRQQTELIKTHMPNVKQQLKDKAEELGSGVWKLMRRGMAGEPNCFYAFEARCVVGTPFAAPSVQDDVAVHLVRFGVAHVMVLADVPAAVMGGA